MYWWQTVFGKNCTVIGIVSNCNMQIIIWSDNSSVRLYCYRGNLSHFFVFVYIWGREKKNLITKRNRLADCRMVFEARKQLMAWTEMANHTIKWWLEHLGALGIMGESSLFNLGYFPKILNITTWPEPTLFMCHEYKMLCENVKFFTFFFLNWNQLVV